MKRFTFAFALFAALILSFGAVAHAADFTLKAAHVLAPDHPYQIGMLHWAKLLKERSNGRIQMDVFPSGQLGQERDTLEGLQLGTLDITMVSTAPLAGFSKEFLACDLPFIFRDRETTYAVLDGEIGQGMMEKLRKSNMIGLSFWENGFRHTTNSAREIKMPSDIKGLKIRTQENSIHMGTYQLWGANTIPMSWGEVYTACQNKTIDGEENTITVCYTAKLYEVQKYMTLNAALYSPAPVIMAKRTWDRLPADLQKIVVETCTEARDFERKIMAEGESEQLQKMIGFGMVAVDVDRREWIDSVQPVYERFRKEIGADIIDKILAITSKADISRGYLE